MKVIIGKCWPPSRTIRREVPFHCVYATTNCTYAKKLRQYAATSPKGNMQQYDTAAMCRVMTVVVVCVNLENLA